MQMTRWGGPFTLLKAFLKEIGKDKMELIRYQPDVACKWFKAFLLKKEKQVRWSDDHMFRRIQEAIEMQLELLPAIARAKRMYKWDDAVIAKLCRYKNVAAMQHSTGLIRRLRWIVPVLKEVDKAYSR
jgi:hypothetical protein